MDDSDVPTVDVTFREGDKNGRQVLKTGSMFRIVERLTFEEHPDQDFQRVFLLTYHAYTDGATVMRYILNRFHIQVFFLSLFRLPCARSACFFCSIF